MISELVPLSFEAFQIGGSPVRSPPLSKSSINGSATGIGAAAPPPPAGADAVGGVALGAAGAVADGAAVGAAGVGAAGVGTVAGSAAIVVGADAGGAAG